MPGETITSLRSIMLIRSAKPDHEALQEKSQFITGPSQADKYWTDLRAPQGLRAITSGNTREPSITWLAAGAQQS